MTAGLRFGALTFSRSPTLSVIGPWRLPSVAGSNLRRVRSEMAFQGSLKELPLPDIIQLVSVSGKTGKFTLSCEADRGFIFLKNGQMVHATIGELIGEEAIYSLAIWNQ